MRRGVVLVLVLALLAASVAAQKSKPWTEWSKKDAEKTLNDSAWAQTQSEGEESTSASSSSAITQVAAPRAADRDISRSGESGQSKPTTMVKYRIRLLTAKPIREAFSRIVVLNQENPSPELAQQLQGFIDRDFSDYIIVAVTLETNDKRMGGTVMQTLSSTSVEALKNNAFLERKDGKRLVLQDYRAPTTDGMGAKFIFPRKLDGEPFVVDPKDNLRFVAQFNEKIKISARYKLSEMFYNGSVEY
jgi:hypothetical protein